MNVLKTFLQLKWHLTRYQIACSECITSNDIWYVSLFFVSPLFSLLTPVLLQTPSVIITESICIDDVGEIRSILLVFNDFCNVPIVKGGTFFILFLFFGDFK